MSALNDTALLERAELYDELRAQLSDRTREVLERRRAGIARSRGWLVRRMLLAADLLGLLVALVLAEWIVTQATHAGAFSARAEILVFLASLPLWVVVAKLYGLYDRDEERTDHSTIDEFAGVFHMVTVSTWSFWVITQLTHIAHPTTPKLILFWVAAVVLVTLARALARTFARRSVAYLQNTIIVGAGDVGQLVARKLLQHPEYGINLIGIVDAEPKERRGDLGHLALLGGTDRLLALVRMFDVERVIVAFSRDRHEDTLEIIRSLRDMDLQIDLVPRLFEIVGPIFAIHAVEGLPLIGLPPARIARSSRALKRMLDIVGASLGLLVAAPVFLYIAIRIKLDSKGPILFRQTRLTSDMRPFTVLKFRTMRLGTSDVAHREFVHAALQRGSAPATTGLFKANQDEQVTRFGRWLRRTSLDELPQLINVLFGDMSLVGPRPSLPYEIDNFEKHHFERFAVRAGITGLWQVTARAHSSWAEALDLDVTYVRSWSLGMDLSLLARTPFQLFRLRTD